MKYSQRLLFVNVCFLTLMVWQPAVAQFAQQGLKLVGTGAAGAAWQGSSVSLSADGNTALVGGEGDNNWAGAAWVYTRSGGVWSQQGSKLVGSGAVGQQVLQGSSVSLSADGNIALVGARGDNYGVGAAWVFTRSGGVWSQQGMKLVGTGAVGTAWQGCSVSLSADGTTALVGGYAADGLKGAAWVFNKSKGIWSQQGAKLVGTGAQGEMAYQGCSVSLSADGNTAIVGGEHDNSGVGAAWIFTRSEGIWSQQGSKLVGWSSVRQTSQGSSVSLSADGNTAIVGGHYNYVGATWVYTRSGGVWSQQGPSLVGTGAVGYNVFQGHSVSLSSDGNIALVGGNQDSIGVGATWVFVRSEGVWSQQGVKLVGTGAVGPAVFQGWSVSLSGDGNTAIVGGDHDNNCVGAVWIFTDTAVGVGANLLKNPGFEAGRDPWRFFTDGTANFSDGGIGAGSARAGKVGVSVGGTNMQLYQLGFFLKAHTRYRLDFKGYSNTGHRLSVSLHKHGPPYTNYGLEDWGCELGASWKTFMREFSSENIAEYVRDGRLRFWFAPYAEAGDEYYIDDVELVEIEPHFITNGDFEWETNGWEFYTDGAGAFQTEADSDASSHVGHVMIENPGSNNQLYQSGIELVAGATYRLSFRARSQMRDYPQSSGPVSVYIHKHGAPYTSYGLDWEAQPLWIGWDTYAKEFVARGFEGIVKDARLRFWFTTPIRAGDSYWIDDVTLTRVDGGNGSEVVASAGSSDKDLPREFALLQNYPNPFNPTTIIRYALPKQSHVTLTVYNTLGERVAELVKAEVEAGYHELSFDGSRFPSGVYFYRVVTADFVSTKKLLLLK